MNIDFSFWLALATLISGLLWFFDSWVLPRLPSRHPDKHRNKKTKLAASTTGPHRSMLGEYGASFFPVLLIVLLLRSFLVEPFQIPSGSMVPTLLPGDFILVNKFSYGLRLPITGNKILSIGEPARGDVMVFVPPHDSRYFIKRVVGLPGDTVNYSHRKLTINGRAVPMQLADQVTAPGELVQYYQETLGEKPHSVRFNVRRFSKEGEWVVPKGHYFMLGDNRNASQDSRYWGFVPEGNIVGKAFAIWMHKASGWQLPAFDRNRLIQ